MTGLFADDRGAGTPLFLLHGLTIAHRMMPPLDPVGEAVGTWHRYYVDLPGHGRDAAVAPMTADHIVATVAATSGKSSVTGRSP